MTLHETSDSSQEISAAETPEANSQTASSDQPGAGPEAPNDGKIVTFQQLLESRMQIRQQQAAHTPQGMIYVFRGTLLRPAAEVFPALNDAVEAHAHTLYMQRHEGMDEILIAEGVLQPRRFNSPWWFHLGLLLLTIVTTLLAGTMLNGYTLESVRAAIVENNDVVLLQMYRRSRAFAFPLLLVLGVHEMGHYIAARLHGVKVTLPFFIPLPIFGSLGTLGAVIFIKSPFRNRKQLFDVGIAGPLAGLAVAIPLFILGLNTTADIALLPRQWIGIINRVDVPPFLDFIASIVPGDHGSKNLDRSVLYYHPQALAAWFGVLLTGINLLPMGQLDGGHVLFAVFGRSIAWPLARLVALTCVFIGLTGVLGLSNAWPIWFIWPFFAMLSGLRHPPPHDDMTTIGWPRMIIGLATFALLPTMIMIAPFYSTL